MQPAELQSMMSSAAIAFQGYDMTNLGRSHELLEHPAYGPTVEKHLRDASEICNQYTEGETDLLRRLTRRLRPLHKTDLRDRVWREQETTLNDFAEAVGLVVGMELAQIEILDRFFGIRYASAKMAFGHSLGELAAVICGGVFTMEDALRVPLNLAADCVKLAQGVTLGVLFSRGRQLPFDEVSEQCVRINGEGDGVVGISAQLSPNSLLVMGQSDTLGRLQTRIQQRYEEKILLRKNSGHWPPIHTPLVWDRCIPNRSAVMLRTLQGGFTAPTVPILSLVTGKLSYNEYNARDILSRWSDHPQRVWDAVYGVLTMGVNTVLHVGPAPNIFPSTFKRLSDNVDALVKANVGAKAASGMMRRPWLKALLPSRAALLRAPQIRHIVLEDWLLEQEA